MWHPTARLQKRGKRRSVELLREPQELRSARRWTSHKTSKVCRLDFVSKIGLKRRQKPQGRAPLGLPKSGSLGHSFGQFLGALAAGRLWASIRRRPCSSTVWTWAFPRALPKFSRLSRRSWPRQASSHRQLTFHELTASPIWEGMAVCCLSAQLCETTLADILTQGSRRHAQEKEQEQAQGCHVCQQRRWLQRAQHCLSHGVNCVGKGHQAGDGLQEARHGL